MPRNDGNTRKERPTSRKKRRRLAKEHAAELAAKRSRGGDYEHEFTRI